MVFDSDLSIKAAAKNRERLRPLLGNDSCVILGNSKAVRSHDTYYPFRQHSHFLFLAPCHVPDSYLMITPKSTFLFAPVADEYHRTWLGDIEEPKDLAKRLGIDEGIPASEFSQYLSSFMRKEQAEGRKVHVLLDQVNRFSSIIPLRGKNARVLSHPSPYTLLRPKKTIPPKDNRFKTDLLSIMLRELRSIKTSEEISLIKEAARVGREAFTEVESAIRPGVLERDLAAIFAYHLAKNNAQPAFETISAAGKNSAILHYTDLTGTLREGELFMMDAGAELAGYACDITRTWAVSGRYTREQEILIESVKMAQEEAARCMHPGSTLEKVNDAAAMPIAETLCDMRILKVSAKTAVEEVVTLPTDKPLTETQKRGYRVIKLFLPHGVSHDLGLDVHDQSPVPAGTNPDDRGRSMLHPLETGRVLTIEPGVYFIAAILDNEKNHQRFADMVDFGRARELLSLGGILIEDNAVGTENGMEWLTR